MQNYTLKATSRSPVTAITIYNHQLPDFKKQSKSLRDNIISEVKDFPFSLNAFYDLTSQAIGFKGHSDLVKHAHKPQPGNTEQFKLFEVSNFKRNLYDCLFFHSKSKTHPTLKDDLSSTLLYRLIDGLNLGSDIIAESGLHIDAYYADSDDLSIINRQCSFEDFIESFMIENAIGKSSSISRHQSEQSHTHFVFTFFKPDDYKPTDRELKIFKCIQALTISGIFDCIEQTGSYANSKTLNYQSMAKDEIMNCFNTELTARTFVDALVERSRKVDRQYSDYAKEILIPLMSSNLK